MTAHPPLPPGIEAEIRAAVRLEWWSLGWLASILLVMSVTMGSSQAMQTAWVEDALSMIPPILVICTARFERRPPSKAFPYGMHRLGSLSFFAAAIALSGMGIYLLLESIASLLAAEHPTIGSVTLFGETLWLGWLMIVALLYSAIAPAILGAKKARPARATMDKVLFTDAAMNKADWQTGLAGIVGVVGIGYGLWWADAAAAAFISLSITSDGVRNLRIATAELLDGTPRELDSPKVAADVVRVADVLARAAPDCEILIRETGRYVRVHVVRCSNSAALAPADRDGAIGTIHELEALARAAMGDTAWRLVQLSTTEIADADRGDDGGLSM